ncbi:GGDEF domain-containing protein [Acholeplasma laidlawii]|uniref:GGDEF domain-containing protein n=1 Tax=Acholeplasma laidlawii TaxID=2148 RepID=UPI0021F7877F|nr:GGDEF domain-containing protein [Acholeplasma laidlawii]
MNVENLFSIMIVVFAAIIALSLAVTHRYVKTIYRGINFLAMGVVGHIIGFIIYIGLYIQTDWIKYFIGNGIFLSGTFLLHKGLNQFMEREVSYKRAYSILSIGVILGILFFFFEPNLVYRQNLISLLIIYLVVEILNSVIKSTDKIKATLKFPIYVFCTLFLLLMMARFIAVNNHIILEMIPGQDFTYNFLSNIIGGILFVVLGFMISVIINIRAITDLKIERALMEKISVTDHLTGLPNRLALEKYVSKIEHNGQPYAVIIADIDEFKKINDTYGHMIGDKVIVEFSKALLNLNDDHMFTARYGGDEFVTIVKRFESVDTLKGNIAKTISTIGTQIKVNEHHFNLTISVGVAIYPHHGTEIYELIHKADAALGDIKTSGKNSIRFYV